MKNRTILIIVVLILTLVAGWVIYQVYDNKSIYAPASVNTSVERGYGQNNYQLSRYIGFDENQQKQFQALEEGYRQELSLLKDQISAIEIKIMVELKEKRPNRDLLHKLSQEVGETHTAIKNLTIEHFLAIKDICTPEQESKISILFSRLEQRSEMGRGRRGEGRGQGKGQGQGRGRRFQQNNPAN